MAETIVAPLPRNRLTPPIPIPRPLFALHRDAVTYHEQLHVEKGRTRDASLATNVTAGREIDLPTRIIPTNG